MSTSECRHLSIAIAKDRQVVYAFLAEPANFPRWASGLGGGLVRDGDGWTAQGSEGPVRIRFSEPNPYGVADHWVTIAPAVEVYVPLRVLTNGDGAEVVLTLFRAPGMDEAKFHADAAWMEKDLASLKALLEGNG